MDLGVPLLTIQAHLDALANEQAGPHEDVAQRALALVVQGEVENHLGRAEENENTNIYLYRFWFSL